MPRGMQDLDSPTRDEPMPPAVEAWNLNHWTARAVPGLKVSQTKYTLFLMLLKVIPNEISSI